MIYRANSKRIPGYCGLCIARCGSVATVEDGRFARLEPDPAHPTGQALCAKGRAAPELVYHPERLTHPLRRTRPKGDPDPGWERIGWDEALELTAAAMRGICRAARTGGGLFSLSSRPPPRSANSNSYITSADERVRHAKWSPARCLRLGARLCDQLHLRHRQCRYWRRRRRWPDIANSGCLILWGYNPSFSRLTHATAGRLMR